MGTRMEKPVVLVVDDDEGIRSFSEHRFSDLGYRVVTATNRDDAMEAIQKIAHDDFNDRVVAFIDVNLKHGPSGLKLLRDIKERYAHQVVPYIFTGSDSIILEAEAKAAGAFEVFHKGALATWDRMVICADPEKSPVLKLLASLAQDALTGLDNFERFEKLAMAQIMAAKNRQRPAVISLLSIDVDHFKLINDEFGHPTGDESLKEIGRTLSMHIRPTDMLCRKSGDEFYVLLPDADEEVAEQVGKALQKAVSRTWVTHGGWRKVNFTISFGAASVRHDEIDEPEKTFARLVHLADNADRKGLIAKRKLERSQT